MANHSVVIDKKGRFTPQQFNPNPGDTVAFTASEGEVILFVDPTNVFGLGRYSIPDGATLVLTVQSEAEHIGFDCFAHVVNLDAGDRGAGGGKTGP